MGRSVLGARPETVVGGDRSVGSLVFGLVLSRLVNHTLNLLPGG